MSKVYCKDCKYFKVVSLKYMGCTKAATTRDVYTIGPIYCLGSCKSNVNFNCVMFKKKFWIFRLFSANAFNKIKFKFVTMEE